jgi:hypothetical protein
VALQVMPRLGGCVGATGAFRSELVLATVTSELEGTARSVRGGDGDGVGWGGRGRGGV